MISIKDSEKGAGLFGVILAIAAIAIIGLIGYRVMVINRTDKNPAAATPAAPKTINNKSDLKQADKALTSQTINSDLDTNQLDKQAADLQ
jgi:hypothetical protein